MTLTGDNPIKCADDDVLNRATYAQDIASTILELDRSEGLVVGVVGPWGSGKTSLLNLVEEDLLSKHDVRAIHFNPWLFSSTDDLVTAFLHELSLRLINKSGYEIVGDHLCRYAFLLAELASIPFGASETVRHAKLSLRQWFSLLPWKKNKKRSSLAEQKRRIEKELGHEESLLVVLLDDIDRLSPREIRDVFRCIRLTAAFPNLVYVVAFDRIRTAQALNQDLGSTNDSSWGIDYIEKIIQVTYNVPEIDDTILSQQIRKQMGKAFRNRDIVPSREMDLFNHAEKKILNPLVRNMRDVRRYANAIRTRSVEHHRKIPIPYLIALEAIRVFLPDAFVALCAAVDSLTRDAQPHEEDIFRGQIKTMIDKAGTASETMADFLNVFFPMGYRYFSDSAVDDDKLRALRNAGIEPEIGLDPIEDGRRQERISLRGILDTYLGRLVKR